LPLRQFPGQVSHDNGNFLGLADRNASASAATLASRADVWETVRDTPANSVSSMLTIVASSVCLVTGRRHYTVIVCGDTTGCG
jgi:hypothetical protein